MVSWDADEDKCFCFSFSQALQQKRLGLVSAVMRSLGLTYFLSTDLKHSLTMFQGNTT